MMPQKIIFYGHPGCPTVPLVRTLLEYATAEFEYINIRSDELGRQHLKEINKGYESVPTLVFPDGSILIEPSNTELNEKLQSIGYEFEPPKWIFAFENLINKMMAQQK